MKNIINNQQHFSTTDIKLQAFLRLKNPNLFIGINKTNPKRIIFLFEQTPEVVKLANGYFQGKEFNMSPLAMANHIDLGKALIFGDYEI